jgi:MarR family transcriptional regulator, organic hydroperoxide resistance regulator
LTPGGTLLYIRSIDKYCTGQTNGGTISVSEEEDLDRFISEVWLTVKKLMKSVNHHGQDISERHELTGPQVFALWQIRDSGPLTMGDLSEALAVTHGVATRMVDRLVDKGMLERSRDESDRRVVLVSLSELGVSVTTEAVDSALELFREVFRGVSPSDREEYLSLLMRIVEAQEGTHTRPEDQKMEVPR